MMGRSWARCGIHSSGGFPSLRPAPCPILPCMTPGSVPRDLSRGGFFQGRRCLSPLADQRASVARGLFLSVLANRRRALGTEDHIPNSIPRSLGGSISPRGLFLRVGRRVSLHLLSHYGGSPFVRRAIFDPSWFLLNAGMCAPSFKSLSERLPAVTSSS
jgi:hypothetical protein